MAYEIVKRLTDLRNLKLLDELSGSINTSEIAKGKKHNVFEPSFDAKIIVSEKFIVQKLNYIH